MRNEQPFVSRVAADVLTGYYKRKRMTQEELAARTDIPLTSLQKKLKGNAPITATDLVMLAEAIGLDPVDVMAEIMKTVNEETESAPLANLSDHRRKKTPAEMTEEEMERERSAANHDDEIGHDEPVLP